MRPAPAGGIAWSEAQARAEILQYVGGLADQLAPDFEKRRRKGWSHSRMTFQKSLERRCTPALRLGQRSDVHVLGTRVFKSESHEFAATLDSRPVVKLIATR